MDISTLYVNQGALAVVRHSGEAVVVDSHIPDLGENGLKAMEVTLSRLLRDHELAGLMLTGFDDDHACADGVDLILTKFKPNWIMYPKYYKDTDSATAVFNVVNSH